MATRAVIRIIPASSSDEVNFQESTSAYIHFYHHCDGYPSGVGRELEHLLNERNDGNDSDGMPTWNGERIAEDLENKLQDYVRSDGKHGDVEYGYVIDCTKRTLTCFDLEFGRRSIDNANIIKM